MGFKMQFEVPVTLGVPVEAWRLNGATEGLFKAYLRYARRWGLKLNVMEVLGFWTRDPADGATIGTLLITMETHDPYPHPTTDRIVQMSHPPMLILKRVLADWLRVPGVNRPFARVRKPFLDIDKKMLWPYCIVKFIAAQYEVATDNTHWSASFDLRNRPRTYWAELLAVCDKLNDDDKAYDRCKKEILKMSSSRRTFFGPTTAEEAADPSLLTPASGLDGSTCSEDSDSEVNSSSEVTSPEVTSSCTSNISRTA
jgi:hypothetical protein